VVPVPVATPYAYQHSYIRDVATVCDILDFVRLYPEQADSALFRKVAKNTLVDRPGRDIGDIGFYLLAYILPL
jgi:hypothetical protein